MDLWIAALAGIALLAGALACGIFKRKTAAPIFLPLTIVLGVLAALCFFYCIAGVLLIMEVD